MGLDSFVRLNRKDPGTGAGTEIVGGLVMDDQVSGFTGVRLERVQDAGFPLRGRLIADVVANEARLFPYDGTDGAGGNPQAADNGGGSGEGRMTLAAGLDQDVEYPGLLYVVYSGTGIGEALVAESQSGLQLTFNRAWTNTPTTGSVYLGAVNCRGMSHTWLKGEIDGNDPTWSIKVRPWFIGQCKAGVAPLIWPGKVLTMKTTAKNILTKGGGSYYHLEPAVEVCAGMDGVKWELVDAQGTQNVRLWGGAT